MKHFLLLVLLFLVLLLSFNSAFAADDYRMSQVSMGHTFSALTVNKNAQALYTDEDVQYSYVLSKVEAFNGCAIAQSVAAFPFGTHWLFPKEYKCIGDDNIINSGIKVGFLAEYGNFYATLFVLTIFVVSFGAFFYVYLGMTEKQKDDEEQQNAGLNNAQKHGMWLLLATLAGILIFVCKPSYQNDDGKETVSLAGIAAMAIIGSAEESFAQYDRAITGFGVMNYPLIKIPKNTNQKVDSWLSVIQYMICNSENTTYGSQSATNNIDFQYDQNGNYTAFAQNGSCVLNVSFSVDPKTILAASVIGTDYQGVVETAAKKYIQEGFTTSAAIANKIVSRNGRTAQDTARQFDASSFTCDSALSYNVDYMSPDGVSLYATASAECVGQSFSNGMNRYPNLSEDFYKTTVKNRKVHLCEQSGFTAQNDSVKLDTTPFLLKAGEDSSMIEDRLKSCVTKMCGSDSSPYVCSAAIQYYGEMSGNRAVTNSTIITKTQNFIATQFTSKKFSDAGKIVFNSFNASYSNDADSILAEQDFGDTAFSVSFDSEKLGSAVSNGKTVIDVHPTINLSTGQAWQAMTDEVTHGDGGMFDSLTFMDCVAYPEQLSPNGRNCGSIFDTVKDFGNTLYEDGTLLIVSVKTSSVLNNSGAERAAETATIGATKRALSNGNLLGNTAVVGGLISAGILETSGTDAYADNNSSMTVMVATFMGILYSVPSMSDFLSWLGTSLQGLGIFLIYVFPLGVLGMVIYFAISIVVFWVEINLKTYLYFILLISKNNGVNETTDYFRVVDELIEFYFTVVIFPVRFIMAIIFIKACFLFNVIDLDSMLSISGTIDPANTFQNVIIIVGNFAVKTLLFVAFTWLIMLEPARTRRFVHGMIFGKITKSDYDSEEYDDTDEYKLDIKRAYSL